MFLHTRATRVIGAALSLAALAAVSGCGSDDPLAPTQASSAPGTSASATGGGESGASGDITVGGANFTEMLIMQNIYAQLLTDAGFTVDIISVENREAYEASLESGEIDVVPEYAATMAEFLNVKANGDTAAAVASSDVDDTVTALTTLAEPLGLSVLDPAEATDQNAFAVTTDFATENNLTTLSDLAALGQPLKLAAAPECPDRPFCEPGLESTYGLNITDVLPLGYDSLETKNAVQSGEVQLGQTGTTDGSLEQFGLVVLEDDKGLQNADNLVPMVNTATLDEHPEIADALNALSAVLTTQDLADMNNKVDNERELASDVAMEYLMSKGLMS